MSGENVVPGDWVSPIIRVNPGVRDRALGTLSGTATFIGGPYFLSALYIVQSHSDIAGPEPATPERLFVLSHTPDAKNQLSQIERVDFSSVPYRTPPQTHGEMTLPRKVRENGFYLASPRFHLERLDPNGFRIIGSAKNSGRPFTQAYDWATDWPAFEFSGMPPDMLLRIGLDRALESLDYEDQFDIGPHMQTWRADDDSVTWLGCDELVEQTWEDVERLARTTKCDASAALGCRHEDRARPNSRSAHSGQRVSSSTPVE
jgi:hypothetical protein